MNATLGVLFVYLGVLVALAIWSRRDSGSVSGYFLGDKKMPGWVVAFSTNATGESGWLLLGVTGMGYLQGATAYWIVVGEILGIGLSWGLVSRRLKRYSDETDSITVPDVLAARAGSAARLIRIASIVILLTMVTTYVMAQMIASGKALSTFVGMDQQVAIVVGAVIIIAYTFVGGFKAVAYTDVVQGVLMLLGLIVVPATAIYAAGGWDGVVAAVTADDPAFLDLFAGLSAGAAGWIAIFSFIGIGLPFLGVPQLLVRYMSARDDAEVRKARVMSISVLFIYTFGAVTAGIAGRALFPGLEDSETIFPTLSNELFPAIVSGVLLVVVLSAVMSTVDSLLLLSSSAVVRDGMQKLLGSTRSDRELANVGKLVTIVIGVIGIIGALYDPKAIFWFVLAAWAGLGCAFGPPVLALLYDKRTSGNGIAAGMICGFVVTVVWMIWIKPQAMELYEAIPGFVAGLLVTVVASRLLPARD